MTLPKELLLLFISDKCRVGRSLDKCLLLEMEFSSTDRLEVSGELRSFVKPDCASASRSDKLRAGLDGGS